jgi:hypothetical protein
MSGRDSTEGSFDARHGLWLAAVKPISLTKVTIRRGPRYAALREEPQFHFQGSK